MQWATSASLRRSLGGVPLGEHDPGLGLDQPVVVGAAHNGGFQHRLMGNQAGLDLDRGDPDSADLEHVVRAPATHVTAGLVDGVGIAGAEPRAVEGCGGALGLAPILGDEGSPANQQVAGLAGRHVAPVIVDQARLVARYERAAGPWRHRARPVGDEDVQALGRSDPVDDVEPGGGAPAFEQRRRQRLAGRDAEPHAGKVRRRALQRLQLRGIERRHAVVDRGPERFDGGEGRGRRRPVRAEHRRAAGPERECHGVAEPVGEEQLGGGEVGVVPGDAERVDPEILAGHHHVAMAMNGALGRAGRSRRIEPEGRVGGCGRRRGQSIQRFGKPRGEGIALAFGGQCMRRPV